RPAFYALRPGAWRDYVTLLHPPYTAWHLSYVAIGGAAAPHLDGGRLGASVLAFFFAVGLSAHALDELAGRPLATRIPSRVLWAIALAGLAGAGALGVLGAVKISGGVPGFVLFGAVILPAYNPGAAGGRFPSAARLAASRGVASTPTPGARSRGERSLRSPATSPRPRPSAGPRCSSPPRACCCRWCSDGCPRQSEACGGESRAWRGGCVCATGPRSR